jgi:hypothetical protein
VPDKKATARSACSLLKYSTKQNPHGVLDRRSRPISTCLTGPICEKCDRTFAARVVNATLPTYSVADTARAFSCEAGLS